LSNRYRDDCVESAPIIFALFLARFGARYSFNTSAEFFDELMVKDKFTRLICGILLALPCVAWVGGQAMGIGFIFNQLTGLNELSCWVYSFILKR